MPNDPHEMRSNAPAGPSPASLTAIRESEGSRPQILVVEDDAPLRDLLAEVLKMEGFAVEAAAAGAAGLELARRSPPDLVVCDVSMPGLDGYAVLAALRRDPATASVPVIFLTGLRGEVFRRRSIEVGVDGYVSKPVRADDLVRAIRTGLAKRAALVLSSWGRGSESRARTSPSRGVARLDERTHE
jgi:CheY-like chemotaxis protein